MKKLFSHLPLLQTIACTAAVCSVFAFGVGLSPHIAHAQGLPPSSYGLDPVQQGQATNALVTGTVQAVADGTKNTLDWGDSLLKGIAGLPVTVFAAALSGISYLGFQVSTFLLGIAGVAFNYAIVFFVFHFATTLGNSPGMLVAWGVVRDFCNIIFLFGFIFMGVITILDLPHYGAKDVLPKFIIAAVLINFSLLGVSAIIDGANVLAAAMYNQAMGAQGTCIGGTFQGFGGTNQVSGISSDACKEQTALNVGLAGKIIEVSRVSTVLTGGSLGDQLGNAMTEGVGVVEDASGGDNLVGKTRKATVMFGLTLFVFAAAIVLAAGTALLLGRAITLALLMVGSPILIIGMVISPLKKQADEYWKMLINNAIFAPVFLLLVFVSLKIAEGVGNKLSPGGNANGANLYDALTKGDVTYFGAILTFVIIIGFLFASLIVAKQFSIRFADKVNPMAGAVFLGGADKAFGLASSISGGWLIRGGARMAAQNMRKSGRSDTKFGMGLTQTLEGVAGAKAGKSFVSGYFGAPLLGALGAPKGGGGAGGGGGHGGAEKTPEQAFLEKSASQRKARLGSYDTQIKAYQDEEKEVDLEIENAQARGDQRAVAKAQEKKAALRKKIDALKTEKREMVLTPAQKEKYDRLVKEGGEKAAEYQSTIERSVSEKGTLDANLGQLDAQIAELTTRLANPDHQGEDRIRDQQTLMNLHSQADAVRQQVLDKSKEIANLQAQLIEHENKSTAELAAFEKESVDAFKTAPLRTYTRDVVRSVEGKKWFAEKVLGVNELDTAIYTLGTNQLGRLLLNEHETMAAISKLRAEELKPADQRAWEHWMHELHEKVHAEVEKEHAAAGDHHAPAPAAAPAQPGTGGGDHGGGGHH